jgi:hypothetical protein
MSSVVNSGSRIFSERGVELSEDGHRFVVKVPSEQPDQAGRTAPIVCYGEYDAHIDEALGASVAAGIKDFAHRIGRTIHSDDVKVTQNAFTVLKKKLLRRRLVRRLTIGALALTLLALIYVLVLVLVQWRGAW